MIEQILTMVGNYIKETDKRTKTYKVLKNLQKDIIRLKADEDNSRPNKEVTYHCSICGKITVKFYNKKYCLECYDKFID